MIRRDFLRNTSVGLASAWFPNAGTAQTHPSSGMNRPTASGVFDVRSYGASGDGKTIDSPAINRAIEAAAAPDTGRIETVGAGPAGGPFLTSQAPRWCVSAWASWASDLALHIY